MKRLVSLLLFSLFVSVVVNAQQVPSAAFLNVGRALPLSGLDASSAQTMLFPSLALPVAATSSLPVAPASLPEAPAPPPVFSSQNMPWSVAAGYEYVHFGSAPFSANLSGLHTSVAYAFGDWIAAEGDFVGAFGGDVFAAGETAKYVLLTGGARVYWDRERARFSPWVHALVGLAHVNPQIADSSKNSFALQAGGGVDYYVNPRLSMRGEGDYVMTRLYGGTQNNFQIGVGFVVHF
jgi:opacity protein-like surface antigen